MFGNILKRKMEEYEQNVSQEVKEESLLEKLVKSQNAKDWYVLDEENAIIVIHSDEPTGYIMIHERLVNNKLIEINRWPINLYYFGFSTEENVINSDLFKVRKGPVANALYDFKKDRFVIPSNTWNQLNFGYNNSLLKKYNNGILASCEIHSDYEKGDSFSYINPVTNEELRESFGVREDYYAILNLDGTIRENKLFKGNSFSKIEEIIDLDEYKSLEAFKQERIEVCNQIKQRNKQHYQEMIAKRNDGSISPYLDSEVMRILEMKK